MQAKKKDVAYQTRKIWVDKQRFLVLRGNRYAKSGRLLKTTEVLQVFRVEGRWYPKKILFKDMLKKGKGTEVLIESIRFNPKIPAYLFSKAALKK